MTTEQDQSISWVPKASHCSWRDYGVLDHENCMKIFGIDGELYADNPLGVVIGDTVYTDSLKRLKEHCPRIDFEDIKPMSALKGINLDLLRAFTRDLDDYYERLRKQDWANIPPWKAEVEDINWAIM